MKKTYFDVFVIFTDGDTKQTQTFPLAICHTLEEVWDVRDDFHRYNPYSEFGFVDWREITMK